MNQHASKMLPPRKHNRPENNKSEDVKPIYSNQLLAGYLAHEFLTRGTLLGKKFEPDSTQANSDLLSSDQPTRSQVNSEVATSTSTVDPPQRTTIEIYNELAVLMKGDGIHIKGIVNPTQLYEWIQM
ncbi:uncharacterized protein LOC130732489 [Lotus japonicus]|uniref:uncharacterized protein LOC130732489 n=1 Tax=Lotus japonicus TaxID=34305 RepID=UPI00258CEDA8|nr:uncharacterized protein LOC130732489 [Lotus japonicus]